MKPIMSNDEIKGFDPSPPPAKKEPPHVMRAVKEFGVKGVRCTCGAAKTHKRENVLIKWAARHNQKTGHGYARSQTAPESRA